MRMNDKAAIVAFLLLFGGSACACGAEKAKGSVKVFLLMGQSNMNGGCTTLATQWISPSAAFQNAVDRVNKAAGNTQVMAILAKSRIDLKGDENYSAYG